MFLTIMLLGTALSMDAFAVSISGGLICKKVSLKDTLKTALTFGSFQALMPFLGFNIGALFRKHIDAYDHYIAFALLFIIGAKMVYEGIKKNGCEVNVSFFRNSNILLLGLATSIDAFLAGLSLSLTGAPIIPSIIIIGTTTFIFSIVGIKLGCRLGCRFERGVDILGGVILIFIGLRTLLEGLGLF